MAAFNYTQPADATGEQDDYAHRTYAIAIYAGSTGTIAVGNGPIPYVTRYSPSGSTAFLYIQTDRTLVTSGSLTTTTNYTIQGSSPPTVTAVTFSTGKSYIRLTLSAALTPGNTYTLTVANNTFGDGVDSVYNLGTPIPIFVDYTPTQSGIDQIVNVGTPVMS